MKLLKSLSGFDALFKSLGVENALCIEVDNLVYLSGFAGVNLNTGRLSEGRFEIHANESLDCFELVLGEMGLSLDHVLKVNCYLKNPTVDFPVWNDVFKTRFNKPYPCRTSVGAPLVVGEIEVDIVAHRSSRMAAQILP
jgi:2-iminobutanoate/2-iminopropanoate deaminase